MPIMWLHFLWNSLYNFWYYYLYIWLYITFPKSQCFLNYRHSQCSLKTLTRWKSPTKNKNNIACLCECLVLETVRIRRWNTPLLLKCQGSLKMLFFIRPARFSEPLFRLSESHFFVVWTLPRTQCLHRLPQQKCHRPIGILIHSHHYL